MLIGTPGTGSENAGSGRPAETASGTGGDGVAVLHTETTAAGTATRTETEIGTETGTERGVARETGREAGRRTEAADLSHRAPTKTSELFFF